MTNDQLQTLLELDRDTIPPDGGNRYNRLIFSRSPYLLQHADNPTDWHEWGDEAFAEAKRRGVPIFVSIGYATCHWCHVMAAESFSDQDVARVLNQYYVPVKIDREERPDLDDFYMTASRLLTGSGGWPLNVFVDHEKRPFFAVTYLPKLPRGGVPGFINLLQNISVLWRERPHLVESNAGEINRNMIELTAIREGDGRDLSTLVADGYSQLQQLYDRQYGGFGISPKFPMPVNLLFLLGRNDVDYPESREMALQTLRLMARGGINDQLSGGFHRYAVDRQWLVPHFEKMLYDQALLVTAYSVAYSLSKDPVMLENAVRTAGFACNELALPGGGFCAALDADTEGKEGVYYTWSIAELDGALGDDGPFWREYWGATESGHVDGRSVLHLPQEPERFAADHRISVEVLHAKVAVARDRLIALREKREKSLRDPKVICSWNGLMLAALAKLARVSGDRGWLTSAERCAGFILDNLVTPDGRLLRSWLGKPSSIAAFAEDYACFCLGLAELAETESGGNLWREMLRHFGKEMQRLFVASDGTVSPSGQDSEPLPVNISPMYDAIIPSAAASIASACIRMEKILGDPDSMATARRIIHACRGVVERNPASCLGLVMAEEELNH